MSDPGSPDAVTPLRLTGRLTIATIQDCKAALLNGLRSSRAVELDCHDGTAFDISFVQLVESAAVLAMRDGVALSLRQPVPAPLASLLAEGGFRDWTSPLARSAA